MTPSSPHDPPDRPDVRAVREPAGGEPAGDDPLSSIGRWAAAGCLGMIAFYLAAFALAIAGARAGRAGYLLVGLLVTLVAATALRSGGRRGRAFLARMVAGAVLAAVVGGALLLLTSGRLTLGEGTASPRAEELRAQLS
jgi:hypothetical protein